MLFAKVVFSTRRTPDNQTIGARFHSCRILSIQNGREITP